MQRPPRFFSRAIFQKGAQPLAILSKKKKKRARKKIDRGSLSARTNRMVYFVRRIFMVEILEFLTLFRITYNILEKEITGGRDVEFVHSFR